MTTIIFLKVVMKIFIHHNSNVILHFYPHLFLHHYVHWGTIRTKRVMDPKNMVVCITVHLSVSQSDLEPFIIWCPVICHMTPYDSYVRCFQCEL